MAQNYRLRIREWVGTCRARVALRVLLPDAGLFELRLRTAVIPKVTCSGEYSYDYLPDANWVVAPF